MINMKKNSNYLGQYEKDSLNFINIYANSLFLSKFLKIESYDFREAFIKSCIGHLGGSKRFIDFSRDFYTKKLKKNYFFHSQEEIDIGKLFIRSINKKNINFALKKKFNYKIKVYFFSSIIFLINCVKFFIKNKKETPKFKSEAFYISQESDKTRANHIYKKKHLSKINFNKFFLNKFKLDKNFFFLNNYHFSKSKHLLVLKLLVSFFLIQQEIFFQKIRTIVLFEGDHSDHEIIFLITKAFNIKSICLQTGAELNILPKAGFHNINHSKYLVWGVYYKKFFKKTSPNLKTIIVGDYLLNNELKKRHNKKKIGIFLQTKNAHLNTKEMKEFQNFVNWLILNFKKDILIRVHPGDTDDDFDILKYKNELEIDDPKKIKLGESLSKCSIMVCYYSSTIITALSMGVIPIIFDKNFVFEKNLQSLNKNKVKIISSDFEILKKAIYKINSDQNYSRLLSAKLKKQFKSHIKYKGKKSLLKIKLIIKQS